MPDNLTGVEATANRLRLIQTELADATAEDRRKYLADALTESLQSVPPHERKAFLAELEKRFPTWEIQSPPQEPRQQEGALAPPQEINDWTFLLQHLLRVADEISKEDRQSLIDRIVEAGLVPVGQSEWPIAAELALRKTLKIKEEKKVSPEHILQLTELLYDFAKTLESVWNTWRKIAPGSSIRKTKNLGQIAAKFIVEEASADDVKSELDRLRRLVAAITAAVAFFGRQIANLYMEELSPEAIKNAARAKRMMECEPAPWWEKYEELSWGPTNEAIQRKIGNLVAEIVEPLLKGL